MVNLPINVIETLKRLRSSHEHYVAVKRIRGHYYAFEVTNRWDANARKSKTLTNYLGTIREDGTFVPARHREAVAQQKPVDLIIDQHDDAILRSLSMDGRIPVPELAAKISMSNTATRHRIEKMEQKYGIGYIASFEMTKYGYTTYMSFVKFYKSMPTSEEIKETLELEERIQMVLLTKGPFDMIIAILATDNRDVAYLINRLKTGTVFKNHDSEWYVSPRYNIYGMVPVRQKFFSLLEKQVWKRTKESPRPQSGSLTERDLAVLKELNSNGNTDFVDIDRKYGFREGTAQYTYYKLVNSGAISRITITMSRPPIKYNAIVLMKIINGGEFDKSRLEIFDEIVKDDRLPTNRFALVCDVMTPFSIMFALQVFEENDLLNFENSLRMKVKGVEIETMLVSNTLIGTLCYRKFDNTYPLGYTILTNDYEIKKKTQKA